jgi:hypothetical protein
MPFFEDVKNIIIETGLCDDDLAVTQLFIVSGVPLALCLDLPAALSGDPSTWYVRLRVIEVGLVYLDRPDVIFRDVLAYIGSVVTGNRGLFSSTPV